MVLLIPKSLFIWTRETRGHFGSRNGRVPHMLIKCYPELECTNVEHVSSQVTSPPSDPGPWAGPSLRILRQRPFLPQPGWSRWAWGFCQVSTGAVLIQSPEAFLTFPLIRLTSSFSSPLRKVFLSLLLQFLSHGCRYTFLWYIIPTQPSPHNPSF